MCVLHRGNLDLLSDMPEPDNLYAARQFLYEHTDNTFQLIINVKKS